MSSEANTPDAPAIDETLPEMVQQFLKSGGKLESIRLHADGRWTHEGCDFENERVVKLFSRSVGRTAGGTWVLEIGRFTYPIEVDDTGYFVDKIDISEMPPTLEISDTSKETLDLSTISYDTGGRLYCTIKNGAFRARFKRHPYYKLADLMREEDGRIVLALGDEVIPLAAMDGED